MPYIPRSDREIIDKRVEALAEFALGKITGNLSLIKVYKSIFFELASDLRSLLSGLEINVGEIANLAHDIYSMGAKYGYGGAYLGELNYAITRLIQRVPQIKVERGDWSSDLRYWIYATTVEALIVASYETREWGIGVSGVFEDIKDEYKRRINVSYEAAQIAKSGDCYNASYYTRLVEVVDKDGAHIGYQEIMLKRSDDTLNKNVLDSQFVLKKKEIKRKDLL